MTTNTPAPAAAAGALAALGNLKAGLANVQQNTHAKGGEPILRLGRDGVWIYGADNTENEQGSKWAVHPLTIQHGYVCWKVIPNGSKTQPELLGEEMRRAIEPKPNRDTLPTYENTETGKPDPWADQISFQLLCVEGEDKGTAVIYKTSSTGGIRASKELIGALMAQLDSDPSKPMPIVELTNDSYQHKQYGKTYVPVFKIDGWTTLDGFEADEPANEDQPEREQQVEEQPAKAAEPAAAEQGGERRRRRRG
jgi:hypothetical protein